MFSGFTLRLREFCLPRWYQCNRLCGSSPKYMIRLCSMSTGTLNLLVHSPIHSDDSVLAVCKNVNPSSKNNNEKHLLNAERDRSTDIRTSRTTACTPQSFSGQACASAIRSSYCELQRRRSSSSSSHCCRCTCNKVSK